MAKLTPPAHSACSAQSACSALSDKSNISYTPDHGAAASGQDNPKCSSLSPVSLSVAQWLLQLEMTLKQCELWQATPPAPAAFASQVPFCYDTMTLPQWLQFVFIPKIETLQRSAQPLPSALNISPIAELVLTDARYLPLRQLLQQLDQHWDPTR